MKRRAFTLIELLVVISIIALLISILLPALQQARESGKAIQCASVIRQAGIALQLYADDHEGYLMPWVHPTLETWTQTLKPYLNRDRGYEIIRCPKLPLEIGGTSVQAIGLNVMLDVFSYSEYKNIARLKAPSNTIFAADTIDFVGAPPSGDPHPYGDRTAYLVPESLVAYSASAGTADYRHLEAANVLYLDIHVERGDVPPNDNQSENNQLPWKGEP